MWATEFYRISAYVHADPGTHPSCKMIPLTTSHYSFRFYEKITTRCNISTFYSDCPVSQALRLCSGRVRLRFVRLSSWTPAPVQRGLCPVRFFTLTVIVIVSFFFLLIPVLPWNSIIFPLFNRNSVFRFLVSLDGQLINRHNTTTAYRPCQMRLCQKCLFTALAVEKW
jgi:hypothetical protein